MIVQSGLLRALKGVHHGFSTRQGGVSSGPYASLNLGLDVVGSREVPGDLPENVYRNRQRFAEAIGIADHTRIVMVGQQVHGNRVLLAEGAASQEADGIIAIEPGVPVAVRTADCAPILIACDGAVAALHGGWRSATAKIVQVAVDRLKSLGAKPSEITAAIGPTISVEHFEVGDEVIEAASASLDGESPPTQRGKSRFHLDLPKLLTLHLERAGVVNIETVGGCTFANEEMFFSHRRDQGQTGRHLSAIWFE